MARIAGSIYSNDKRVVISVTYAVIGLPTSKKITYYS